MTQLAGPRTIVHTVLRRTMIKACSMGLLYYTAVFAVAFALGMARALIIAPHIGESAAVILEVPVVVFVSWAVARQLLKRHPFSLLQSAAMGAIAFVLTMASEVVLAGLLRGQSAMEWASNIVTPIGLLGLAGQVTFAVMPMLVAQRGNLLSQTR
jgi:hypothetical protein